MPRVTYSATKGLIQEDKTGNGFVMGTETVNGTDAATPGVACTLSTTTAALSLAAGAVVGQLKWFISTTANDVVITPASTAGAYATITLTNIGDSCCMMWTGSGWALISRMSGAAQGATAVVALPVVAS